MNDRQTTSAISTRILCACLALGLNAPAAANDFSLSPVGVFPNFQWGISTDGGTVQHNPPLVLIRGQTYTFKVTGLAAVHSFYIKTVSSTGALNAYNGGGLSSNGITTDTPAGMPITFTVPRTAPDTLFYNCGVHTSMAGPITVDGVFADGFE
jgi:hypothetical protein